VPNTDRISRHVRGCDAILVTHAHYDHLMDVPMIQAMTGARVFAGGNASRLLRTFDVPASAIRETAADEQIGIGPFHISVLRGDHVRTLGGIPISGGLGNRLRPPQRVRDYRSDRVHNYHIAAGARRLLLWSGPRLRGAPRSDVLVLQPFYDGSYYQRLIDMVRPNWVIPVHWDDFTRPLSKPLQTLPAVPSLARLLPHRLDMEEFRAKVLAATDREISVLIPERLRRYDLNVLLSAG
jgi:L-ascorbate metabolism protein UlaG (beta-lactamase superfamily)